MSGKIRAGDHSSAEQGLLHVAKAIYYGLLGSKNPYLEDKERGDLIEEALNEATEHTVAILLSHALNEPQLMESLVEMNPAQEMLEEQWQVVESVQELLVDLHFIFQSITQNPVAKRCAYQSAAIVEVINKVKWTLHEWENGKLEAQFWCQAEKWRYDDHLETLGQFHATKPDACMHLQVWLYDQGWSNGLSTSGRMGSWRLSFGVKQRNGGMMTTWKPLASSMPQNQMHACTFKCGYMTRDGMWGDAPKATPGGRLGLGPFDNEPDE
ncbi:hypothetical protein DACRYDRAFT_18199 [Dacryopinax primogenitus]|uniref:Uncharacterized protein n=1 Tax=Dacryopinax primogenitus (strain DJM 731) TaxID=1858805 RepID=M5FSD9_DACPD|nr:uncharacterized protein DACRYDRAFT_18199 [Dacryopinax primogenitus]EJT98094.1 hypothetical protein DACRYDRAFT_18199 [Dacryopinax primogenitus]